MPATPSRSEASRLRARRAAWALALWVALLYGTLGWVRPLASWLRARGQVGLVTALATGAAALVVAGLLLRRERGERPLPLAALGLAVAAGVWLAADLDLPEERVHIASYGLVGALAWRAWSGGLAAAAATVLGVSIGDELIQGLLPSRVFDLWDIAGNAAAGLAALCLAAGGRVAWGGPAVLLLAAGLFGLLRPSMTPPYVASAQRIDASAPYPGRSVLFVSVDALRADFVPPWGAAPLPTPGFARLARESLSFEEAAANAIWTTPAMLSYFSGLYPEAHGVGGRGLELAPRVVTPLETLTASGWHTLGFAGDASETYRNLGFQAELERGRAPEELVVEALERARAEAKPVFLWLHLRQIHAPYDASPERLRELGLPDVLPDAPILERARHHPTVPRADFPDFRDASEASDALAPVLRALYAAELADADAALGRILAALDAKDLARETLLVVTADHGEELLEHGGIGHASTTLDSLPQPELVRIPLYLRLPDRRGAGQRVAGRIEQVDLLPTLLPLLGLHAQPAGRRTPLDGRDLSAHLPGGAAEGQALPRRPLLVSSSPCGWQCPPERRDERVHAWVEGARWALCREQPRGSCPQPLAGALERARQRGQGLRTPVASPAAAPGG